MSVRPLPPDPTPFPSSAGGGFTARRGQKVKLSVTAKDWSADGGGDPAHFTHAAAIIMFFGGGGGPGFIKATPVRMTTASQQLSWQVIVPPDAPLGPASAGVYYCNAAGENTTESTNVLGPQKGVVKEGTISL